MYFPVMFRLKNSLRHFFRSTLFKRLTFFRRTHNDKEHFHGEERGDGSLAIDRVRRPRSMTTGVCSKTVARGHKIRANPPHSTLRVCPLSIPFACGRNESKWRHRTLTTLTHFPLRSAPLRSALRRRACCWKPRLAEMHSHPWRAIRSFSHANGIFTMVFRVRFISICVKMAPNIFFNFISRCSYFPFQARRIRCKLCYQARNTVQKSFYYLCSFMSSQLRTIAI